MIYIIGTERNVMDSLGTFTITKVVGKSYKVSIPINLRNEIKQGDLLEIRLRVLRRDKDDGETKHP